MKRIFKWSALFLCALVVIAAGLWGYVHTEPGRSAAAGFLSAALSDERTSVKISGLDLTLPHRFGFAELTVSDSRGQWLAVEGAFLRWDPRSVARGRIRIIEVGAASIHAARLPEAPEGPAEASGSPPLHLLSRLSIASVSVASVSLDEPVAGFPLRFKFNASMAPAAERSGAAFSFDLVRIDGPGGHARIKASVDASLRTLAVEGHISDPAGGVVSTLAGRSIPLDASISGTGPLSMWTGSVDVTVGDLGGADLTLTLEAPGESFESFRLEGSGNVTLESGLTGKPGPDSIRAAFHGSFSEKHRIEVHGLRLVHRDADFTARGAFDPREESLNGAFSLRLRDLKELIPGTTPRFAGALDVDGAVGGTLTRPVLDLEIAGSDMVAVDFAAGRITASALVTAFRETGRQTVIEASAGASAFGPVFPGGVSFPDDEVSLKADIRATPDGAVSGNGEAVLGSWFSTRFRGTFSSGTGIEVTGDMEAADLSAVSGLSGSPLAGSSRMDFSIRGSAAEPLVVRVDGSAQSDLLTGLAGRPWPGGELLYRGTLEMDEKNRLHLTDATVADGSFRLSGHGSLLPPAQSFSGNLVLNVPDLSLFSTFAATPLSGSADLEARAEGKPGEMTAELSCDIQGAHVGGFPVDRSRVTLTAAGWFPDIAGALSVDLASGQHRFQLNTGFRNDRERIVVDDVSFTVPGGTIKGRVGLVHESMLAEGGLEYRIEDPGILLEHHLKGQGAGEIRFFHDGKEQKAAFDLKGSQIDTPFGSAESIEAFGEVTGLLPPRQAAGGWTVSGLKAGDLQISSATGTVEPGDAGWMLAVDSDGVYRTAFSSRIAASLSVAPGSFALEVHRFDHVHGGIPVRLDAPAGIASAGGVITVESVSLSIGDGALRGSAELSGAIPDLDVSYERIPLAVAAALGFDAGRGLVSGNITLSPEAGAGMLRAHALVEGFRPPGPDRDGFPALEAEMRVEAGGTRIEGTGEIRGPGVNPLTVKLSLPLEYQGDSGLPRPAPGGAVEGRIAWMFDLADLQSLGVRAQGELSGSAELEINIRGTAAHPEPSGTLQVKGGAYRDPDIGTLVENIGVSFSANMPTPGRAGGPERLSVAVTVSGLSRAPFEVGAELPLTLSLAPFSWGLPGEGPVNGFVRGDIDLAMVPAVFSLDRHYLQGLVKLDLDLAGTVELPLLTGSAVMSDGYFEDVQIGVVLENIILELEAAPPRVNIVRGEAQAGRGGRVKAAGWLEMASGEGVSYSVSLEMLNAAVLRRDDAFVVVDGLLSLAGSGREASITGQVQIERAEFTIPDRVARGVPLLDVVEIHDDGEAEPDEPATEEPGRSPVSLDLTVESPGRLFVSGRGLESEWKGVVHIEGRSPDIQVDGKFSLVRGYFNLLGKRFSLTRGTIELGGSPGAPPVIDVAGVASSAGMTAEITVSGPVSSLSIQLSSNPPYPSDEILSRLLFGRSLAALTPLQAVQLAQAARTLAGGGGPDIFGRTRRLLGVDQLELMQSDEYAGEASVRAGKYIGDRIYLQVEQGIGADRSKASVEVELTPNLSLETEIGADSRGGVGIMWKWDY